MNRQLYLRKALAVVLTLIMAAGLVFTGAPENAYAATSKRLVSKVVCYTRAGNKWKQTGVIAFTYNKYGDPVKIYRNNNGNKTVNTFVYIYRNGKKVKATQYVKETNAIKRLYSVMVYDKAGRLKKNIYADNISPNVYKYGKKGYIAKIEGAGNSDMQIHYKWNGKIPQLLKVKHNEYTGVYTQTVFNNKGLIEKTSCSKARSDGSRNIRYSFVNGRVKAIRIAEDKEGKRNHYKYVLKYTGKNTSTVKYRAMINYITCRYPVYTGTNWF